LVGLRLAVLLPFEAVQNHPTGAHALPDNAEVLQVVLMAHLLCHSDAVPLWEKLGFGPEEDQRPVSLDQTVPVRDQILNQLNSLSMAIRGNLDLSLFAASRIGEEASEACIALDPSNTTFASGADINKLKIKYANLLDIMLTHLDHSGKYYITVIKLSISTCN
jgi:hypothetical protein